MTSGLRQIYKKFMCSYLGNDMPWIDLSDSYKTVLEGFCEYIYDYDPLMLEYPEDYGFPEGFYEYIQVEYAKYCSIRDPKEDAKVTAKQNATIILTVKMSDGDVKEYDDVSGQEDFMYDFCEDIRDIAGDDFASEEIDDVADAIFYEGINNGGTLTEEDIYSLAQAFLFGE